MCSLGFCWGGPLVIRTWRFASVHESRYMDWIGCTSAFPLLFIGHWMLHEPEGNSGLGGVFYEDLGGLDVCNNNEVSGGPKEFKLYLTSTSDART